MCYFSLILQVQERSSVYEKDVFICCFFVFAAGFFCCLSPQTASQKTPGSPASRNTAGTSPVYRKSQILWGEAVRKTFFSEKKRKKSLKKEKNA